MNKKKDNFWRKKNYSSVTALKSEGWGNGRK